MLGYLLLFLRSVHQCLCWEAIEDLVIFCFFGMCIGVTVAACSGHESLLVATLAWPVALRKVLGVIEGGLIGLLTPIILAIVLTLIGFRHVLLWLIKKLVNLPEAQVEKLNSIPQFKLPQVEIPWPGFVRRHLYAPWWWRVIFISPFVIVIAVLSIGGFIAKQFDSPEQDLRRLQLGFEWAPVKISQLGNASVRLQNGWSNDQLHYKLEIGPPVDTVANLITKNPGGAFTLKFLSIKDQTLLLSDQIPFSAFAATSEQFLAGPKPAAENRFLSHLGHAPCDKEKFQHFYNTNGEVCWQLHWRLK